MIKNKIKVNYGLYRFRGKYDSINQIIFTDTYIYRINQDMYKLTPTHGYKKYLKIINFFI